MNIYEVTKGTKLEKKVDIFCKAEENGAGIYAALAFLTKERGLDEVSDDLMKIAEDEIRHAGIYAVLNGHSNSNIFETLKRMSLVESNAVEKLQQFAKELLEFGLKEASEEVYKIALDEGRHGDILKNIVEKHCLNIEK